MNDDERDELSRRSTPRTGIFYSHETLIAQRTRTRFGRGFTTPEKRALYPFRILYPVAYQTKDEEVRLGPLTVANIEGEPIMLCESPQELEKEGFYKHKTQEFGLKHLVMETIQPLAEAHAPREANLYMPLILDIGEELLALHDNIRREHAWMRPRGKKVRTLEAQLERLRKHPERVTPKEYLRVSRAYHEALKKAHKGVERELERKVRKRWGRYTDEFHPVLGIQYYQVTPQEIERLQELVRLIDTPNIPWPETTPKTFNKASGY